MKIWFKFPTCSVGWWSILSSKDASGLWSLLRRLSVPLWLLWRVMLQTVLGRGPWLMANAFGLLWHDLNLKHLGALCWFLFNYINFNLFFFPTLPFVVHPHIVCLLATICFASKSLREEPWRLRRQRTAAHWFLCRAFHLWGKLTQLRDSVRLNQSVYFTFIDTYIDVKWGAHFKATFFL